MANGFHARGRQSYLESLKKDYDRRLAELQQRLDSAGSIDETEACRAAIRELKAELKERRRAIPGSLF